MMYNGASPWEDILGGEDMESVNISIGCILRLGLSLKE